MFPQWKGSGFASGLGSQALIRMVFDSKGGAKAVDRWDVKHRVRDIEEAPDGSLWMIEDANPGGVFRLTPVGMAVSAPLAKPNATATSPAALVTANDSPAERV